MSETPFKIIAYCCRYCSYAAADLAGVLRLSYPAETRIVQIPCTGRLDMLEVLHAFEHGADGVMVAGCLEGDCHFQEGNLNARRRVEHIKQIMLQIGLEPERIEMFNLSSAMARQFADAATSMTQQVIDLGPNPLRVEDHNQVDQKIVNTVG
ncbi:MAG: heterodisulfide reductase subunit MvhD [Anaerolineae bacterium SM23_ 63]|nr:MAG: heterodisulfide reductase subunit MvhD [Anaerolineae bacterium SM23_ 63]HEY47841.1 hydrogenase iron-sulfur subunit [Anaerolineae bacterium]